MSNVMIYRVEKIIYSYKIVFTDSFGVKAM